MSLNISGDLVKRATKITVTVDTANLGPRQLTACKRMIKTGIITGDSTPGKIAAGIRQQHGQPVVKFGRYSRFSWSGVESKDFHDRLIAACVAQEMQHKGSGKHDWRGSYIKANLARAQTRQRSGSLNYTVPEVFKPIMNEVKLPEFDFVLNRFVDLELLGGVE